MKTKDTIGEFMMAIVKKDEQTANSMVEHTTKIPEIRENTPLQGQQVLPSPQKNKKVIISYFERDFEETADTDRRIAFIWELTVSKDKITSINVVYDGSNPFMNEPVKDFRKKFNKEILVPSYFPFDVTHVQGSVNQNDASWYYANNKSNGRLEFKVTSYSDTKLENTNRTNTSFTLKNGKKVFLENITNGYQLTLLHEDLKYIVSLKGEKSYKPSEQDLIEVGNSTFPK
ncbi:hypothetical protein P4V41_21415 [Fictibacillus nanhaiensis]|uniref:hypothetical protein n=1 Tax=Fictibacillus nanhaiensis TaxID=742169 RepID=UPI002E1BB6BE|nr:hypothetical protein [Fictibacillus nanhaiensis]